MVDYTDDKIRAAIEELRVAHECQIDKFHVDERCRICTALMAFDQLCAELDTAIQRAKAWEDAAEVQQGKADAIRACLKRADRDIEILNSMINMKVNELAEPWQEKAEEESDLLKKDIKKNARKSSLKAPADQVKAI